MAVTSSPPLRKGLPMAKTNGNQVLPNVVPASTTTACLKARKESSYYEDEFNII